MQGYKTRGFGAKAGVDQVGQSKPLLGMGFKCHIVSRPMRGQGPIMPKCIRLLLDGAPQSQKQVFVSDVEWCPERPLILVYGEDKSTEVLRQDHNLDPREVFILGNTCPDTASAYFPFACQYLVSLTEKYEVSHLLPNSFFHFDGPWLNRRFCCFISCRETSRKRALRAAFATALAKSLRTFKGGKIDSLGKVTPALCQDKSAVLKELDKMQDTKHFDRTVEAMKSYKFVIAFENNDTEGYITEKVFCALFTGAVPIWRGAKGRSPFNSRRVIDVSDFDDVDAMVKHAVKSMQRFIDSPPVPQKVGAFRDDVLDLFGAPAHGKAKSSLMRWLRTLKSQSLPR